MYTYNVTLLVGKLFIVTTIPVIILLSLILTADLNERYSVVIKKGKFDILVKQIVEGCEVQNEESGFIKFGSRRFIVTFKYLNKCKNE